MAIDFVCPGCRNRLRVPDEHAGKQAQCPECLQISQVPYLSVDGQPLADEPPVVAAGPGPDPRLGPGNPYAPHQATSPPAVGYLRPHRGTLLLVLGVVSICCPCGHLLGIVPIVMANADLAAMARGEMDPSGSGLTQAARILGIIALVLMAVAVVFRVAMVAAHG